MAAFIILLSQALDLLPREEERFPAFSDMEATGRKAEEQQHLGFDVFALWTRWDAGMRVKDGWGMGGDVKLGLEWGSPIMLNFKLGYAGWNTANNPDETFPGHADIRQYRAGVGVDFFAGKLFDFGLYTNFGFYHFQSRPSDATSRFLELQGMVALKPVPHLKIGLTGIITFVGSDFNRSRTHLSTNQSIGPIVELEF